MTELQYAFLRNSRSYEVTIVRYKTAVMRNKVTITRTNVPTVRYQINVEYEK